MTPRAKNLFVLRTLFIPGELLKLLDTTESKQFPMTGRMARDKEGAQPTESYFIKE